MINLFTWLKSRLYCLRNEKGATAVEYGIMVALIAVVVITAVALIGTNLDAVFDLVGGRLAPVVL